MNRVTGKDLGEGLHKLRQLLLLQGYEIQTSTWQGTKEPPTFLEVLHAEIQSPREVQNDRNNNNLFYSKRAWCVGLSFCSSLCWEAHKC